MNPLVTPRRQCTKRSARSRASFSRNRPAWVLCCYASYTRRFSIVNGLSVVVLEVILFPVVSILQPSDPPPSLQPHYRAFIAPTGRSAPALGIGTLASRCSPLALLPWHPRPGSRSSTQKPVSASRPLYAGRHLPRNQVPDRLVPAESSASGFGDIYAFRRVIKGSLTFVSRIRTCPNDLRTFDPTLTTTPFKRSSLDWFGAGS